MKNRVSLSSPSFPSEVVGEIIGFLSRSQLARDWIPLCRFCFWAGITHRNAFRDPVEAWKAATIKAFDEGPKWEDLPEDLPDLGQDAGLEGYAMTLETTLGIIRIASPMGATLGNHIEKLSAWIKCAQNQQIFDFEVAEINLRLNLLMSACEEFKLCLPSAGLIQRYVDLLAGLKRRYVGDDVAQERLQKAEISATCVQDCQANLYAYGECLRRLLDILQCLARDVPVDVVGRRMSPVDVEPKYRVGRKTPQCEINSWQVIKDRSPSGGRKAESLPAEPMRRPLRGKQARPPGFQMK